jgi:hypothetical protein
MGNSQRAIDAQANKLKALELRKAGKSYDEIAKELGYRSKSGAHNAVMSALKKTLQEPANELRKLEVERLDAMLADLWESKKENTDRILRIMERRAKLLGLDAPTKIAPTDPTGEKTYDPSGILSKLLPEITGRDQAGTAEQTKQDGA